MVTEKYDSVYIEIITINITNLKSRSHFGEVCQSRRGLAIAGFAGEELAK